MCQMSHVTTVRNSHWQLFVLDSGFFWVTTATTTQYLAFKMPSNDKYTFKVFADGMALDEYEVEEKENIYSCWIASEAGKVSYCQWA